MNRRQFGLAAAAAASVSLLPRPAASSDASFAGIDRGFCDRTVLVEGRQQGKSVIVNTVIEVRGSFDPCEIEEVIRHAIADSREKMRRLSAPL